MVHFLFSARGETKVNAFFPISGSVLYSVADVLIYLRCVNCQRCPHMNVDGQLTTDLWLFTNKDVSGIVRTWSLFCGSLQNLPFECGWSRKFKVAQSALDLKIRHFRQANSAKINERRKRVSDVIYGAKLNITGCKKGAGIARLGPLFRFNGICHVRYLLSPHPVINLQGAGTKRCSYASYSKVAIIVTVTVYTRVSSIVEYNGLLNQLLLIGDVNFNLLFAGKTKFFNGTIWFSSFRGNGKTKRKAEICGPSIDV